MSQGLGWNCLWDFIYPTKNFTKSIKFKKRK